MRTNTADKIYENVLREGFSLPAFSPEVVLRLSEISESGNSVPWAILTGEKPYSVLPQRRVGNFLDRRFKYVIGLFDYGASPGTFELNVGDVGLMDGYVKITKDYALNIGRRLMGERLPNLEIPIISNSGIHITKGTGGTQRILSSERATRNALKNFGGVGVIRPDKRGTAGCFGERFGFGNRMYEKPILVFFDKGETSFYTFGGEELSPLDNRKKYHSGKMGEKISKLERLCPEVALERGHQGLRDMWGSTRFRELHPRGAKLITSLETG
jgi:hypothetical protein